jgi:hypothetical protein
MFSIASSIVGNPHTRSWMNFDSPSGVSHLGELLSFDVFARNSTQALLGLGDVDRVFSILLSNIFACSTSLEGIELSVS